MSKGPIKTPVYKGYFKMTIEYDNGTQTHYFPPEAGAVIGRVVLMGGTRKKVTFEPITEAEYLAWGLEKFGVPEAE